MEATFGDARPDSPRLTEDRSTENTFVVDKVANPVDNSLALWISRPRSDPIAFPETAPPSLHGEPRTSRLELPHSSTARKPALAQASYAQAAMPLDMGQGPSLGPSHPLIPSPYYDYDLIDLLYS